MNKELTIAPCLVEAIDKIKAYMIRSKGIDPTAEEMADALTKFFVLKEIGEFIEMQRKDNPT